VKFEPQLAWPCRDCGVRGAINDLRADCIIDLADRVLTILDPAMLENYAMAPVH
jgi:hypothetical protein